jgi:ribonuclease BN (tRNA processing enzyme)
VSPLTLTVLGCDGSHAGPGGAGSGYLVRDWESRTALWLDAGPGTFAALQRFVDPGALSAIVLSHEHADHWLDVEGFVTAARWTLGFDRAPVPVLAAPGIRPRLTQDPDGVLDWREVGDGDVVGAGGLRLRFSRTDHPPVTLGVRIEGPSGVVGYSADSGPGWSLEALGRDLDLALCEATYTEDHETEHAIHMSGRQAGRSARQARARRLVVTHRWPTVAAVAVVAEAAAAFGGRVDAAEPGVGYSP